MGFGAGGPKRRGMGWNPIGEADYSERARGLKRVSVS